MKHGNCTNFPWKFSGRILLQVLCRKHGPCPLAPCSFGGIVLKAFEKKRRLVGAHASARQGMGEMLSVLTIIGMIYHLRLGNLTTLLGFVT